MSTTKYTLDAHDPTWWHYPVAAVFLAPLCWLVLLAAVAGRSLFGHCALHSGCGHDSQDIHRHVALALGCAQLALALASWPMPLTRRRTITRFVLFALSALCGVGAVLVVLMS
ncbi:hypothetical protein PUR71_04405 [Streptomyces sp. SP17BM10]|uniref:hypothetical protein n=1 Tax=Streptomyces sp. SP17BM10 TaxID=3002530 RepID=UPI002E796DE8|nr:hypothetical protein [Streptomyces sp. SP17BM10]MEE1782172.1 hypothetical protein [Streptomyces sp. SP17BM10]